MRIFRIILFILAAGLCSCPCVTEIETPTVAEPEYHANVVFINCIRESESAVFSDKYKDTLSIIDYTLLVGTVVKVAADIENYISVNNPRSGRLLYLSPVELKNGDYITFIAFGDTVNTYAILLNDSLTNYSRNNAYIRIINLYPDSAGLKAVGTGNFPVNATLGYSEYSSVFTAYTGKSGIDIQSLNNDSIASVKDYDFQPGYFYNLILRPGTTPGGVECFIVATASR